MKTSQVNFNNCISCINGMLIQIYKFSKNNLASIDVRRSKFFLERKGKYRLNLIVVCNYIYYFINNDISYPNSTSDYLVFYISD